MDLNDREERLRFLLSKIDSELSKFKEIKNNLDKKREDIAKDLEKLNATDANISLVADDQENVSDYINGHVLELENLRNYISGELQKTIKQIEILAEMKKKYGNKVTVEETQFGGVKIKYTDEDVLNAAQTTNLSKKLVQSLKDSTLNKKEQ